MKIGDLVTSYWKGFYEIVKIERRWRNKTKEGEYYQQAYCIQGEHTEDCGEEMNSLIHVVQLYKEDGAAIKRSKTIRVCDSAFCKPAKEVISSFIEYHKKSIDNLQLVLKKIEE
jgi:hypothetical protein